VAEFRSICDNHIPPGYKDEGKEQNAIGDYLIWLTILDIGKSKQLPVLFVSGDEKSDWYHQSESQALYPRYELVDEYRRASGGHQFHMVNFSGFLDLFGATRYCLKTINLVGL
jgi:hypothetical protein